MGDRITPQLVRHDLSRRVVMPAQQPPEKSHCGVRVSALLDQHIDSVAIMINGSPQVPLLTLNLNEDLVNEKGIAVALVLAPHSMRLQWSELVAPEANRFMSNDNSPTSQQILDIPIA